MVLSRLHIFSTNTFRIAAVDTVLSGHFFVSKSIKGSK